MRKDKDIIVATICLIHFGHILVHTWANAFASSKEVINHTDFTIYIGKCYGFAILIGE
jgi:hypothetical protein